MVGRILLVDDDPNIVDTARDILEDAGYEVLSATTTADALAVLRDKPVALVIADYNLPDGKGVALAAEIENLGIKAPVLLMSGEAGLKAEGPVKAVLSKPVYPPDLLKTIQSFM